MSSAWTVEDGLRFLAIGSSGLISQLPGIAVFVGVAPPLFLAVNIMTIGCGLGAFVWVFAARRTIVRSAKNGLLCVVAAVILLGVYSVLLPSWTVDAPFRDGAQRIQVGFGMVDFSLTEKAIAVREKEKIANTPYELMLAFGGFEPGGVSLIWKPWTVVAAGSILIGLFLAAYMLWAIGLAQLAWSGLHGQRR